MPTFRQWLEANLGLGPAVQDLVLFPLFAAALVWALVSLLLSLVANRVEDPERRRRLRSLTIYGALVLAALLLSGIWLSGVRRFASLLDARSPEEVEAIQAYLDGCLYVALATAAMVLAVRFVRSSLDVVTRRMTAWASHGDSIRFRGLKLVTRKRVRDSVVMVARVARAVTLLLLVYIYIPLVMSFFPATAPYGAQLLQYVAQPAMRVVTAVVNYLPNLLYLWVILISVWYALKLLKFVLDALGSGALVFGWFEAEWAQPTYKLLRAVVVVFTLMVSYPYLPGAESEFFTGFSLFVGALVTVGSTAAIGNLVSGIILTYTGSFRIGDRVGIGDSVGDVVAKTLFVTRIRTIENEDVTFPNGVVLGGKVVNYSKAAGRGELQLTVRVGLGYDVHWSKIDALLKEAARRTDGIVPKPEPIVWPANLGDFAVVYELRAYTAQASKMGATYAALRRSVLDVLHGAGVEIMTPNVEAQRSGERLAVPPASSVGLSQEGQ